MSRTMGGCVKTHGDLCAASMETSLALLLITAWQSAAAGQIKCNKCSLTRHKGTLCYCQQCQSLKETLAKMLSNIKHVKSCNRTLNAGNLKYHSVQYQTQKCLLLLFCRGLLQSKTAYKTRCRTGQKVVTKWVGCRVKPMIRLHIFHRADIIDFSFNHIRHVT